MLFPLLSTLYTPLSIQVNVNSEQQTVNEIVAFLNGVSSFVACWPNVFKLSSSVIAIVRLSRLIIVLKSLSYKILLTISPASLDVDATILNIAAYLLEDWPEP